MRSYKNHTSVNMSYCYMSKICFKHLRSFFGIHTEGHSIDLYPSIFLVSPDYYTCNYISSNCKLDCLIINTKLPFFQIDIVY